MIDESVRGAIAQVDTIDEPFIRILRASLTRRFPAQAAFVLKDVEPTTGAGSVVVVAKLLARLDALANDPARAATRDDDRKALDLVAQRGYGPQRLAEIRALVTQAQASPTTQVTTPTANPGDDGARTSALAALHGWWKEWSEITRAVIRRRDYLIALGLARRAAPKKS